MRAGPGVAQRLYQSTGACCAGGIMRPASVFSRVALDKPGVLAVAVIDKW